MDEEKRLYLEQEIQEMMEAFERYSHERLWSALFKELPESKDGIEAYPDLVYRTAALACLMERGMDETEIAMVGPRILRESGLKAKYSRRRAAIGMDPDAESSTESNLLPSLELRDLVDAFYEAYGKESPNILFFNSPLQSTVAASWMLAALENDSSGLVYLPIVRAPDVLSLHTNNLLMRQPYFLRFEPESVFMLALSVVRKRKEDPKYMKEAEIEFRNGTRLHGWFFQELINSLGLHFERGLITVRKDGDIEEALEHPLVYDVLDRMCAVVDSDLAEKLQSVQLKVRHFAVAQRVSMRGDYDSGWLIPLRFIIRRLPADKISRKLNFMQVDSRDWWAFPNVTIATKRPVVYEYDEHGAPHKEDGKAIEFADGFGVYAINGERIQAEEFEVRAAASREQAK